MCLLCVEIQKDKITFREVGRALSEFVIPKEHKDEFNKVVTDKYGKNPVFQVMYDPDDYSGTD